MLEFLQTGKALSVFAVIGAIGIISKLITRSLYKRLVKETDNMAMTKNKNLKVLKQKLENAYRLNQNIVNTQAYLDKQIYTFKFMHISLNGWNSISLQMTILGLLAGGVGSFMSYWYRLDSYYIILYASVGALGGLLLTFLDSCFNISLKQQRLANALLEYVDNSVFVRVARENSGREAGYAAASREFAGRTAMTRMGAGSGSSEDKDSNSHDEREMTSRENDIRDGLVRSEEPRRTQARNLKTRNVKAEELLRTVRNMKDDNSSGVDDELEIGSRRREKRASGRQDSSAQRAGSIAMSSAGMEKETAQEHFSGDPDGVDGGVRQDIEYLKHSLEQIAASKERPRSSDDWAKNLDADELKVIGEIMRQYFAGN